MKIAEICALAPVVPVIVIEDAAHAAPLARALVAGGLRVLEVTHRTAAALDAIRAMAEAAPGAIVGAGTLISPADVASATAAGACFGVSPASAETYLALPNVVCVGGSWVCPTALMRAGQWNEITPLARDAAALRP